MTTELLFRKDQLPVHADLEPAPVRGEEIQRLDIHLELLEQIGCQAHGPVGVMSDRAIDDLDLKHEALQLRLWEDENSYTAT